LINPDNIILIGFICSGKTTLGKKLASILNKTFIDLDEYIEKKTNKSINEIFEIYGSSFFRKIENECLFEVISKNNGIVLATGGGTPCFFNNLDLLLEYGIVIYLKVDLKILINRILNMPEKFPLLKGIKYNEIPNWVENTLIEREKFYLKAHLIINPINNSIEKIVNIIDFYKKNLSSF